MVAAQEKSSVSHIRLVDAIAAKHKKKRLLLSLPDKILAIVMIECLYEISYKVFLWFSKVSQAGLNKIFQIQFRQFTRIGFMK